MMAGDLAPVSPNTINKIKSRLDNIRQRCYNPKNNHYKWYGKKGIKVCDAWLGSYEEFIDWALKNGYSPELTIERIDVNKGYTPDNCTWVKPEKQYWNRTDTVTNREKKTRICQKCKVEKPLSSFHRNASKPLGRHYVCKPCRNGGYDIA